MSVSASNSTWSSLNKNYIALKQEVESFNSSTSITQITNAVNSLKTIKGQFQTIGNVNFTIISQMASAKKNIHNLLKECSTLLKKAKIIELNKPVADTGSALPAAPSNKEISESSTPVVDTTAAAMVQTSSKVHKLPKRALGSSRNRSKHELISTKKIPPHIHAQSINFNPPTPITSKITIKYNASQGKRLFICGSGAGLSWQTPTALEKVDNDTYVHRIEGNFKETEYKVLLDGVWEESGNRRISEGKEESYTPRFKIAAASAPVAEVVKPIKTTRISINFNAGWGNKLFIRGSGPGMSWLKGLEMKMVEGKWVFETTQECKDFEYKILLNDDDKKWSIGANYTAGYGNAQDTSVKF